MLHQLLDIILHVDQHLDAFIHAHGPLTYALLAAIVFCETGLVVLPFLPGDSLLFAAGAVAARGELDVVVLCLVLLAAAIAGDNVNYFIGRKFGARLLEHGSGRILNRKNFDKTHGFVERHGAKSVLLGRFVPIVRTFCPFVAGVGAMDYRRFVLFDTMGAVLWVGVCVGAGHLFGNIPAVKKHFELAVVGVIAISLLPLAIEFLRARSRSRNRPAAPNAQIHADPE